jgi:hypothetical protein
MEEVSFGLLEWLKQADVGFSLPEIAWNVRSRFCVSGKTVKKIKKIFTVFPIDESEATIFFTVFQPTNQKLMT